jgi:phosphohistidine phosphatase
MTRQLILMRHAKSSWDNPAVSDHARPLNARGRTAAPRMARQLLEHQMLPDMIVASTATRVRETLALMQDYWNKELPVLFEESLYLASREALLAHLRGLHDSWGRVMLVGHNPGLSELASILGRSNLELPTAAIVAYESRESTWGDAVAAKAWNRKATWLPRELAD